VADDRVIEAYLGEKYAKARRGQDKMLLETRNLNIGYGDIQILWDIHLNIDEGEIVALAGSNGAEKQPF